jgi:hypothetical protein
MSSTKTTTKQGSPVVIAYGGGTDSTAMIVRMVTSGERIDLILFADTGAEVPRTYEYLETFDAWLRSKGYPGITRVHAIHKRPRDPERNPKGSRATIEDAMIRNVTVPPVAFGMHTCSILFKINPQDEFLRAWAPAQEAWARGAKVVKCVGFDAGEDHRVKRCNPYQETEQYVLRFPLREWGWTRAECIAAIEAAGLPQPGKSACYFCPARKADEILELAREYPELMQRALAIEAAALKSGKVGSKSTKGLNRNFTWASLVEKNPDVAALLAAKQKEIA